MWDFCPLRTDIYPVPNRNLTANPKTNSDLNNLVLTPNRTPSGAGVCDRSSRVVQVSGGEEGGGKCVVTVSGGVESAAYECVSREQLVSS